LLEETTTEKHNDVSRPTNSIPHFLFSQLKKNVMGGGGHKKTKVKKA
jgi:hypothetical protein